MAAGSTCCRSATRNWPCLGTARTPRVLCSSPGCMFDKLEFCPRVPERDSSSPVPGHRHVVCWTESAFQKGPQLLLVDSLPEARIDAFDINDCIRSLFHTITEHTSNADTPCQLPCGFSFIESLRFSGTPMARAQGL